METPPPLTRRQLFEAVWTIPVDRLARRYGISGVGLAKLCRRRRIPLPPRGHWAKPAGRRPRRPSLPTAKEFPDGRVVLTYRPPDEGPLTSPRSGAGGVDPDVGAGESRTEAAPRFPVVEVTSELANPHPLVERTLAALRSAARQAPVGVRPVLRLRFEGKAKLDVEVTEVSMERAMRLSDALLKALDARGHSTREAPNARHPHWDPLIQVLDGDDWFTFRIQEEVAQIPHAPTKSELRRAHASDRQWSPPEWDSVPSGRLKLFLYSEDRDRLRAWGDGKKRRLENHLGEVVFALEESARRSRALRDEWERRRRAEAEVERRRVEEEKHRKRERARLDALLGEVTAWSDVRALRTYLAEVRAQAGDTMSEDSDLQAWLTWADGVADRLDPLPRRRPRSPSSTAGVVGPPRGEEE